MALLSCFRSCLRKRVECIQENSNKGWSIKVEIWEPEEHTASTVDNGKERVFTFNRDKSEQLGATLTRISGNVSKFVSKAEERRLRKLHKKDPETLQKLLEELPGVDVRVLRDNAVVETSEANDAVWVEGAVLQIADSSYTVELNVPAISSLKLPKTIVSGFPCYPRLDMEFAEIVHSDFTWFRENRVEEGPKKKMKFTWEQVHQGHTFTPTNAEIGKRLKLVCTPRNGSQTGDPTEAESKVLVSAGPGLCPFENRQAFTTTVAPEGQFRVVSYNVLANTYADSDFARTKLFSYCPPYALDFDYRKLLLLKEITGYNADIICLQECDLSFFRRDLRFVLEGHGMEGSFLKKYGEAGEGEAIFYRSSKFKFIEETEINLTETLKANPKHADLWSKVQTNEELKQHVENRTNCLQTVLLESRENSAQRVLVATTHLFFHPKANLIRVLQAEVILKHLEELLDSYEAQFGNVRPCVLFCGDLNSCPTSSVVEYINTGMLPDDSAVFFSENNERMIPATHLQHSLRLTSGCGTPEYTNFTAGFKETLDHVFIDSDALTTTQVIPMPSREELSQFVAIPSVVFPSDHIALVCDLAFRETHKDA